MVSSLKLDHDRRAILALLSVGLVFWSFSLYMSIIGNWKSGINPRILRVNCINLDEFEEN
jgi:hypothetical protein